MSGSSLDGIDIAHCSFDIDHGQLTSWKLIDAKTIPYSDEWIIRLKNLPTASAKELVLADADLGHTFGESINSFLQSYRIDYIDLISSHGHTIFHFPELKSTTQIGDGSALVSKTNIDTVTHLRSMDIAFGGQGAPIAPLGDRYLYPGYDYYLNLGGIANISADSPHGEVAFDIVTCNQLLNGIAQEIGLEFDRDGIEASKGKLIKELLSQLQQDEYLSKKYPKSLDNTWSQTHHVLPAIQWKANPQDKLFSAVEFIANEISRSINSIGLDDHGKRLFATGGGALNRYLIKRIQDYLPKIQVVLPSTSIIQYKEAAFIAFAGLCRYLRIPNLFASVTGAEIDSINGALYTKQSLV